MSLPEGLVFFDDGVYLNQSLHSYISRLHFALSLSLYGRPSGYHIHIQTVDLHIGFISLYIGLDGCIYIL